MDPQVPQYSFQFWDVEWLFLLHLQIPGNLNRVEFGKIVRSVNGVYVLLFK